MSSLMPTLLADSARQTVSERSRHGATRTVNDRQHKQGAQNRENGQGGVPQEPKRGQLERRAVLHDKLQTKHAHNVWEERGLAKKKEKERKKEEGKRNNQKPRGEKKKNTRRRAGRIEAN